jgi:hypothetical protein
VAIPKLFKSDPDQQLLNRQQKEYKNGIQKERIFFKGKVTEQLEENK